MAILLSTLAWGAYWFIVSGLLLALRAVLVNTGLSIFGAIAAGFIAVAFTMVTDDFLGDDGWITVLMNK